MPFAVKVSFGILLLCYLKYFQVAFAAGLSSIHYGAVVIQDHRVEEADGLTAGAFPAYRSLPERHQAEAGDDQAEGD